MQPSDMIPTNVNCIIIGTGLTNSILAAACSRIGKSVLHLDTNKYYGDDWASFTFQQLIDWIKNKYPKDPCLNDIPEELLTKSRMFCIDLCPKLLYSNGPMVELLVKSNVSRYHEFKNNIRILSMIDDDIHVMPCQRSDVFTSPLLSDLTDKRRLMKLIEMCVKYNKEESSDNNSEEGETNKSEIALNADKPIGQFLEEKGLKYNLREFVINSIAMVSQTTPTLEACENVKKFMIATEKYGKSPFLLPLYGCGEFPQSFCRLSAVFGGVYCLNTQIDNVKIDSNSPTQCSPPKRSTNSTRGESFSVTFSNQTKHEVKSDMLVMDYNTAAGLNMTMGARIKDRLSRAILITNKSIMQPNDENVNSFLRLPPSTTNANIVHLLEFNSSVMVCPPGLYTVYLWTRASLKKPENDLRATVDRLYSGDKADSILWQFYYHQLTEPQQMLITSGESPGLHMTNPPKNDIDYVGSIEEAQELFRKMCPGEEFLPRAPDPDEIIST